MHGPEVSVIVPAYNSAATLGRALESVASQQGVDWELVVVDDGSVDATFEVASSFAREYGRTQVISRQNAGRSAARNVGIRAARGTWLCFLDADDRYVPGAFRAMLDASVGCDLVWSAYETPDGAFGELGAQGRIAPREAIRAFVDPRGYEQADGRFGIARGVLCRSAWAKLIRADLVVPNGIVFPEGLFKGEDGLFSLRCIAHAREIGYVGRPAYYWDTSCSKTCVRFERRHSRALGDYAACCWPYLEAELRSGVLLESDVMRLIAREAASTLSDAATKGGRLRETVQMLAPVFGMAEVRRSLGSIGSLSRVRELTWGAEARLLRAGHIGMAVVLERLGAALK